VVRLSDPDPWWHLATGRWIVEHHAIPHADPFSFTMAGAPWRAVDWLLGLGIWGSFALAGNRRCGMHALLVALPCYAAILIIHFNLKLWAPHINPALYDGVYWGIDQQFRWLVDFCMATRVAISGIVPLGSTFYLQSFMLLFYVGFCYHAFRTPEKFRELTIAAMLLQGLGGISYMAFPALGPFLYEHGLNETISDVQQHMLAFYLASVQSGPAWLAQHGSEGLAKGLAAMPSLHAAGTFMFILFAWKHARRLVVFYAPFMLYILVAAVATRWHYLIDLPAGVLLAWISVQLAGRLVPADEAAGAADPA